MQDQNNYNHINNLQEFYFDSILKFKYFNQEASLKDTMYSIMCSSEHPLTDYLDTYCEVKGLNLLDQYEGQYTTLSHLNIHGKVTRDLIAFEQKFKSVFKIN